MLGTNISVLPHSFNVAFNKRKKKNVLAKRAIKRGNNFIAVFDFLRVRYTGRFLKRTKFHTLLQRWPNLYEQFKIALKNPGKNYRMHHYFMLEVFARNRNKSTHPNEQCKYGPHLPYLAGL